MWRLILLGVVAVAADDRWSRQTTDRRQGDWIPVAAPSVSFHSGRSVDQSTSGSAGLPSVLTPPIQQHARLLPPPPPDGLFQHSATSGFIGGFPSQQSLIDTKPRQFLPQQNINNQQSTFRFKDNPQLSDSAGIPSNLFQVGPQQFTQSPNQQNAQLISNPPFLSPQFLPPPQRAPLQPFVQFNSQLLPQNLQFPEFPLQSDQPSFLSGSLPPQQVLFNQLAPPLNQPPGRFSSNVTNDFKQEIQNQGKEEVQLLYVPVETLRQRGRTFAPVRGNKKVEPSNTNQNTFNLNQPVNLPVQTTKSFFRPQSTEEQFYKQIHDSLPFHHSNEQLQHVIKETTAPQIQYKQTLSPQVIQEQTTYAQDIQNTQPETVTPLPTNTNKYRLQEQQSDELSRPSNQQYTLEQFQQETVTPGKPETSKHNFYQSQQFSGDSFNRNNQDAFRYSSLSPDEHHTTVPPPHQPPLSVYMETNAHSKIADVLTHLKSAKTIPVLDSIGPDSPQVFVGPSNLNPPSGYLKFELPYLSSLDNNRVERKVDKLPFFVAPLNFQPPPGYSKIPFPAPHIGSVVVSNITILKTALHEKPDEYPIRLDGSTPSDIPHYPVTADLSSYTPQLPSLVNSLQDERYFPSPTTTEAPTTLAQTTPIYTTPYRRNPARGSHRVYTTTTETPTRRPVTRQRRPHNGRPNQYRASQIVSTTTPEPIVATTPQQYDQSEEQQKIYSEITTEAPQDAYNTQNVKESTYDTRNQNVEQYHIESNQDTYSQHQNDQHYNQNLKNLQSQGIVPQLEQVQQYFTQLQQQQYLQENQPTQKQNEPHVQNQQQSSNYNSDAFTQAPVNPVNQFSYSSNGISSDAPEHHTTEAVSQRVSSYPSESSTAGNKVNSFRRDPLRQRFRGRNPHQTTTEYATTTTNEQDYVPQRIKTKPSHGQTLQIVKDTNYPENYPTNTERLDDQSTERNEEIHFDNYNNDFRQPNIQDQQQTYQGRPQTLNENEQFYQQYNINPLQQNLQNRPSETEQKFSSEENDRTTSGQSEHSTPHYSEPKETTETSNANTHNSQQTFTDTVSKYEDNEHVTDRPINQQRLTKYTRVRGRVNQGQQREQQTNDQHNQNKYDHSSSSLDNVEGVTESELEQTTTPKTVVRVRGRVRNRQRTSGVRQTTTTEPPNYPIESGLVSNPDSHYTRRPAVHRKTHADRTSNYNRHTANRYRNSNSQSHYNNNNNENVENESINNPSTTASEDSGSTTTDTTPVSRKYNHLLNRNLARRPSNNRQVHQTTGTTDSTQSTPLSDSGSTTKYLVRTTRRPTTQVTKLSDGRARIRRPSKAALTTTTEYPQLNSGEESFAPSAASNEVLDPYYPSQTNFNNNHNLQYSTPNRSPNKHSSFETSTILTPTPFAPANADDYWNQGFTIQQSNSYDFSAESSPVTQSTLSSTRFANEDEEFDDDSHYSHKSTPSWSSPSRQTAYTPDQTPFSSNEQYVSAGRKTKLKQSSHYSTTGKENQWNEKAKEDEEHEKDTQEQLGEQYESESSLSKNYETEDQHRDTQREEEIPENEGPVYKEGNGQTTENEKDKPETSYPNEAQLAFTSPEDIIRTKDGFIQRKPVDPVTGKKSGRRRGAWVRVRVHKKPKDVFETAESQNLASLSNNNAIKSTDGKEQESDIVREYNIPPNHRPTDPYSTVASQTTISQTTTEQIATTTPADESFQQSLTDMIREIIKEEEKEEERQQQEAASNKTTTLPTFVPDEVTETVQVTTTPNFKNEAITVIPEAITQSSTTDVEGVTTVKDDTQQEENTTIEPHVLGTSTTTEISLETEICYRGRCVKSKKNKKPLKPISAGTTTPSDLESDLMLVE